MVNLVRWSLISLLIGCSPSKLAEKQSKLADKQLNKIAKDYPQKISKYCANVIKRDTLEKTEYDFIEVACDTIVSEKVVTDLIESKDTIIRYVKVPSKTKTITITYEDSSKIQVIQSELYRCSEDYSNLVEKTKREKGATNILSGLLALMILVLYFVSRKKK